LNLFVSVILPVKNEERFVEESLSSLLAQDYDREGFEILVVDDHSTDRTRQIVEIYLRKDPRIRLLTNVGTGTASARNVALMHSNGDVIVNFSGHVRASKSFLRTVAFKLVNADQDVAAVGCKHETASDEPFFARVAGLALSTYMGGIGSTYRQYASDRYVSSVAFASYRHEILNVVGGFDESMRPMGDDLELNLRLGELGYRLLYTPATVVYHRKDSSLVGFSRRMLLYGIARAMVTIRHPRQFNPVHAIPSTLLLILVACIAVVVLFGTLPILLISLWSLYVLTCLVSALFAGGRLGTRFTALLMAMYPIMHFTYGLGYIAALPRVLLGTARSTEKISKKRR